jgi:sulfur carrier protein ThiS
LIFILGCDDRLPIRTPFPLFAMPATIQPYGMLRDYVQSQNEVTVEAGRTVRATLHELGIPPDVVALVTVNDVAQNKDYVICDGDVVRLLAVIGGG